MILDVTDKSNIDHLANLRDKSHVHDTSKRGLELGLHSLNVIHHLEGTVLACTVLNMCDANGRHREITFYALSICV